MWRNLHTLGGTQLNMVSALTLGCIHCECGKSTAQVGGSDKGDLHQWAGGGGRRHSPDHPCLSGPVGQRLSPSSANPGKVLGV